MAFVVAHDKNHSAVLYLGASLPFAALAVSIKQTGGGSVWLTATSPEMYQRNGLQFMNLLAGFPGIRFVLGGQAITAGDEQLREEGAMCAPAPVLYRMTSSLE